MQHPRAVLRHPFMSLIMGSTAICQQMLRCLYVFVHVFINELGVYVQVWPGATHFPDFLSKAGVKYWGQQLQAFHDLVPYDGLWIDMDEASNFCTGDVCRMPQGRLCQ